jgi:hypothetical protein
MIHCDTVHARFREATAANVRVVLDTSDLIEATMGQDNQTWIRVDLVVNVSMPSPTVAFGALTSRCTCTVLECQLALQAAGLLLEDIATCLIDNNCKTSITSALMIVVHA